MKVLIGCEESQTECLAFRSLGYDAFSCDIKPCSGGHPEYHLQCNVLDILDDDWDLAVFHPSCTYLSNAGSSRLKRNGVYNTERVELGLIAKEFFLKCLDAPIPFIALENPMPGSFWELPKYNQIIEPFYFCEPYKKRTCLLLHNLPKLEPTDIVVPEYRYIGATNHCKGIRSPVLPGLPFKSSQMRSKSFQGIAYAMAAQWGQYVSSQL